MRTHCHPIETGYRGFGRRRVEAKFDAGQVTSDAGGLLLPEAVAAIRMMERVALALEIAALRREPTVYLRTQQIRAE